jgi:hypothetical protein
VHHPANGRRARNRNITLVRVAAAFAAGAAIPLAVACSRDPATRAADQAIATAASSASALAGAQPSVRSTFAEASTRLLPVLERLSAREELEGRLSEVAAAVEADDARALDRAVVRAERTLTRLQRTDAATMYTTDLDAIRLALGEAQRLLKRRSRSAGPSQPTRSDKR